MTPPRVLLVDDYEDALESWRLYLSLSGYDVITATNGGDALRLAAEFRPAVVVLDLDLPDMTGSQAARQLRAAPETSTMPLIAATGFATGPQMDDARTAGFDAVMVDRKSVV